MVLVVLGCLAGKVAVVIWEDVLASAIMPSDDPIAPGQSLKTAGVSFQVEKDNLNQGILLSGCL